jgi:hypothetical protein
MYRIEVSPGEETVFRTIEELATGIRNGVITSRSRIHHGASGKWLPIEFHPHYKKAAELAAHPPSLTDQTHAVHATPTPKPARPPRPSPTPLPWASGPIFAVEEPPAPVVEPAPTPPPKAAAGRPQLPKISYPEIPLEEPEQEQPLFRGRRKMGRRPLLVAAVIVAAVGARFMLAAAPPTAAPEELPITVLGSSPAHVDEPEPRVAPTPEPAAEPTPPPAPRRASLPTRAEPSTPSVPGPAFAPSLPVTAIPTSRGATVTPPTPAKAVASPPEPTSAPAIEPAPAQIDLALPGVILRTDSIALIPKSADSNAMRRILKAVTGTKAQPTKVTAP